MFVRCQMFIIVAIIYSSYRGVFANERGNCDCDVLQVKDPKGFIGNQNFTTCNTNLRHKQDLNRDTERLIRSHESHCG